MGTTTNDEALTEQIRELAKEKNAVILAHNYQVGPVQDLADLTGDSLELSIRASRTDADLVVFCGVHFMAESASILSPHKRVLLPRLDAGCPMADMIDADQLREFKAAHPGALVVTYVNSTAEVKAESDICCTSANAVRVVESLAGDRVLFTPDRNLGRWVQRHTRKEVIVWDGYCPTHDFVTAREIQRTKEKHPGARIVVHPECTPEVIDLADAVRSTSGMIAYVAETDASTIIVGTEVGLIHRLKKERPDVKFVSPSKKMICPNMKKIGLEHVRRSLLAPEDFEVKVPEEVRLPAVRALERMIAVPRD